MPNACVPEQLRLGPFTPAQAARHGVSESSLRSDPWREMLRGVWVHRDIPDTRELRLAAVKLILREGTFICGPTTAWVYGIDVEDPRAGQIWVGCLPGRRLRQRAGVLIREVTVAASDLQLVDGVLMTTPTRTVFDCGRWLSLVESVVVADALAHDGLVTVGGIASYAASHRGLRGVRQLDRVVELIEPKSESPMETRVRLLMVLSGLPRPLAQLVIKDANGFFVARADLAYERERVVVEYDGAFHWEQRQADDRRRTAMRELGWTVIVVGAEAYYKYPEWVVGRVRAALV